MILQRTIISESTHPYIISVNSILCRAIAACIMHHNVHTDPRASVVKVPLHLVLSTCCAALMGRRGCYIPAGDTVHTPLLKAYSHRHTSTDLPCVKFSSAIFTHVCKGSGIIMSHGRSF